MAASLARTHPYIRSPFHDRSPEGGTPGTNQTFRIEGPPTAPNFKLGEEKTVLLTVKRDATFTQPVALKAESQSPKVGAKLNKTSMDGWDKDVTLTVTVVKDAPVGPHVIKVTGTPKPGGKPTSLDVKVDVVAQ